MSGYNNRDDNEEIWDDEYELEQADLACVDCSPNVVEDEDCIDPGWERIDQRKETPVRCVLCGVELFSEYLAFELIDDLVYLLAVNVTHYRHEHVAYYNNSVGYTAKFHDYEGFKSLVSERAKRQIIRKAHTKLSELGVTVWHLRQLQGTTPETVKLAKKYLPEGEPVEKTDSGSSESGDSAA